MDLGEISTGKATSDVHKASLLPVCFRFTCTRLYAENVRLIAPELT